MDLEIDTFAQKREVPAAKPTRAAQAKAATKKKATKDKGSAKAEKAEIKHLEKLHATQMKEEKHMASQMKMEARDEKAEAAFLKKQAKAAQLIAKRAAKEAERIAKKAEAMAKKAAAKPRTRKVKHVEEAPKEQSRKAGRGTHLVEYNAMVKKYRELGASLAEARKQASAEMKDAKSMMPK
jgi:hypothetical protein